jgi:hypothetical protein
VAGLQSDSQKKKIAAVHQQGSFILKLLALAGFRENS